MIHMAAESAHHRFTGAGTPGSLPMTGESEPVPRQAAQRIVIPSWL